MGVKAAEIREGDEGKERVEARTYTGMGHVVGGVCVRDLGVWVGAVLGDA